LRDEIAAHPGKAVPVVDDQANKVYFLVEEASLLHMQGLAAEQDEESQRRLKALIQEGIDVDHVSGEEGEAAIRRIVQTYSDKIA
jgi:hypothetical protein